MNDLPTLQEFADWPEPDVTMLPQAVQDVVEKRHKALRAVIGGRSVVSAATDHGVNRNSLTKMVADCTCLAPDGKIWGRRVCIPYRSRQERDDAPAEPPTAAVPGAFAQLLRAVPAIADLCDAFRGALPTRERKSRAFEKLFKSVLAAVRKQCGDQGYPFNTEGQGRRPLQDHIKQLRADRVTQEPIGESEPTDFITQAKQVFDFNILERLEFDAHRMDVDFSVEIVDDAGVSTLKRISCIWLLLLICSVSRLIIGWALVVGRGYSQVDVMRVFCQALTPWAPRTLLPPDLHYVTGSGIGTVPATNRVLRGIFSALDNALAHHARLTTTNLTRRHRGVLHLGRSRVPETRGLLEALFRQLEVGAIRALPGGFEPPRDRETPKRGTTSHGADDHPVNMVALRDLADVILSGHNVTMHTALGERAPMDAVRAYCNGGGWAFESSLGEQDIEAMTLLRFPIHVRGNRKKGRLPFVNYQRARYRSPILSQRWDLLGKRLIGRVSFDDLRYLTLLEPESGEVITRLTALPPWGATRHDLDLRHLIRRWTRRKLFSIEGAHDAVEAYRDFVRKAAASFQPAVDQTAKYPELHGRAPATRRPNVPAVPVLAPRGGWKTFDTAKDSTK